MGQASLGLAWGLHGRNFVLVRHWGMGLGQAQVVKVSIAGIIVRLPGQQLALVRWF